MGLKERDRIWPRIEISRWSLQSTRGQLKISRVIHGLTGERKKIRIHRRIDCENAEVNNGTIEFGHGYVCVGLGIVERIPQQVKDGAPSRDILGSESLIDQSVLRLNATSSAIFW